MTTTTTAYETAAAVPVPLSRRAEQREDARLRAELDLARVAARAEQRREDDRAWAEESRQAKADKAARKTKARADRARANAARMGWLREHMVDLLFVPVIVVPALLAWTAMAAYGASVWGPLGFALPLFSEGAMWTFDAAVAIRRRHEPDMPVWHFQLGIAIFGAYAAALNFLHGMAPATAHHGLVIAISMALVSVAGVIAHQLVIAGPRRSRAERELARFRREAERRQTAARKAATHMALIDIDEEGHADLVYAAGTYRLSRSLTGARRLAAPKGRPAPVRRAPRAGWPPAEPEDETTFEPPAQAARTPLVWTATVAGEPAAVAGVPATEPATGESAVRESAAPPPHVPRLVFYGPAAAGDDSGRDGEDGEDVAPLAGWPKEAVAERLATEIRAAADAGTVWKPDYEQLIGLTDRSRRTCEAIVSLARRLANDPGRDDQESSQSSRDDAGIVPAAARTPVFRPAGAA